MRSARLVVVMVAVAAPVFAGELNYDAFSDQDGHIRDEQVAAAQDMVRDQAQLEAVFADAKKGNQRAARVFHELETIYFPDIGREVANRAHSLKCQTPIYRELSGQCRPDWTYLDFLPQTEPGIRLRRAVADAYATRAKRLGIENAAIVSAVSALLAVGTTAVVVRSGEARAVTVGAKAPTPVPATQQAQVIALGLDTHLKAFAEAIGGRTWKQWAATDPVRWRTAFLDLANNPLNKIKFNLTGVDDPWRAATRAASGGGTATDWELLQIKIHPSWWERTTFFRDGRAVANPFQ